MDPEFPREARIKLNRYSGKIEGRLLTLGPHFPSTVLVMYDYFGAEKIVGIKGILPRFI